MLSEGPAEGAGVVGAPHALAQVGAGAELQEGDVAGMREVEDPAVPALLAGGLGAQVPHVLRQALQVRLVRQLQAEGVGGVEGVLAVAELQQGQLFLHRGVLPLVFRGEQRAAAHEPLVAFFEQLALVRGEVRAGAPVVDGLHAGEKVRVEADVHLVVGQQGRDLLRDLLHRVVALGLEQVEEQAAHALQRGAGEFQGLDGIGEGRRVGVGGDGVHLRLAFGDGGPEGGQVVLQADLVEARSPEGKPGRSQ